MVAFSQVKPAALKLRALPIFPSNIVAGAGIDIDKNNGVITVRTDFSNVTYDEAPTPAEMAASYVPIWDKANSILTFVPTSYAGQQGVPGIPGDMVSFNARAQIAITVIPIGVQFIRTAGYAVSGDRGEGVYERVASQPSHPGKVQSADGAWFELRTVQPNVMQFGAKGDGATDDTTAILNATAFVVALGGGKLIFPDGTFNLSSRVKPSKPVRFIGAGAGSTGFASMPANHITRIRWVGGLSEMFRFDSLWQGFGIEDMELDGNGLAYATIWIDSCCAGTFKRISSIEFLNFGLVMQATLNTSSWHHFEQTNWDSSYNGNSCIDIDRSYVAGYANTCHVTFLNTRINHAAGRTGILLASCDNIIFIMTTINASPGWTDYGVRIDPTVLNGFPGQCMFYHIETQSGWYQPSTTQYSPAVVHFRQSPQPTLNGSPLTYSFEDEVYNLSSSVPGTYGSGRYMIDGRQVVGKTKLGYTFMTGTFDKSTPIDTETCTLVQLARRVAVLEEDARQHGLIG